MSNDLREIKKYIYENNLIEELLLSVGCQNIKLEQHGELITATLPDGSNSRSVQVRVNESLNSHVRSRGFSGDIFGLISFIHHKCKEQEDIRNDLFQAKAYICNTLKISNQFTDVAWNTIKAKTDFNWWLRDIQKARNKSEDIERENKILNPLILKQYIIYPVLKWIEEGLSYDVQKMFSIGIDIPSERIIIPVHDRYGNLISIKGRRFSDDDNSPKYLYLYNYNKSIELFNFHRSLNSILQRKKVLVFESEKSCMKATQYNFPNCVAIGGDLLSKTQIKILKELGMDIEIIICYDKDKDKAFVQEQCKLFGVNRLVYYTFDENDLFKDEKASPVDLGLEVWLQLYDNRHKYRIS